MLPKVREKLGERARGFGGLTSLGGARRPVGNAASPARGESATKTIAFVGCGYVADLYMAHLSSHPELRLLGVTDRVSERRERFAHHYGVDAYPSLDALLADERVEIVVNLTNPRSHYEVSRAALLAGKHVYCEKPLAMAYEEALELVELAESRGLQIVSAPCNVLSETAQTLWKALREHRAGRVRAVYAEMDDGMVHRMAYRRWLSVSGVPWPYKDEFEVGCTLEHAGYYLTWLLAFFGPVQSVTAFSSTLIEDKVPGEPLEVDAPDFSVACLEFRGGIVARLTCSIVGEHDHALRIFGDDGVLSVKDCWFYRSPVAFRRLVTIRRRTFLSPLPIPIPLKGKHLPLAAAAGSAHMDFCRGIGEMAEALGAGRTPRLSPRFSLHLTEVVLAIHNAGARSSTYVPRSTFEPMEPMEWAR